MARVQKLPSWEASHDQVDGVRQKAVRHEERAVQRLLGEWSAIKLRAALSSEAVHTATRLASPLDG
jgi:hypothetical protein